jgi:FkbM family methyltransferase
MNPFRILAAPWRTDSRKPTTPGPANAEPDTHSADRIVRLREGATEVAYCTPTRGTRWRVETLFSKEPDTIEWIRGFQPGEVLADVGANVGMYSIWAAKTRGARVYAFEPEAQNFALLNRNIAVNDLGERVTAFCLAISDAACYSVLHVSGLAVGQSGHMLGEDLDHNLQPRKSPHRQGCVAATLDELVEGGAIPVPAYLKVDVDGLEHKVMGGVRRTLTNPRLKSILIEINDALAEHRMIVEELGALGFRYSEEQVRAARRATSECSGIGNYVFRR